MIIFKFEIDMSLRAELIENYEKSLDNTYKTSKVIKYTRMQDDLYERHLIICQLLKVATRSAQEEKDTILDAVHHLEDEYEEKQGERRMLQLALDVGELIKGGFEATKESRLNNVQQKIETLENEVERLRQRLSRIEALEKENKELKRKLSQMESLENENEELRQKLLKVHDDVGSLIEITKAFL